MKEFIAQNQEIIQTGTNWIITKGSHLLIAILIFRIGLKIINLIVYRVDKMIKKSKIDKGLQHFIHSTLAVILKVFLIVIFASIIGVPMSSFIAMLGAAGLAIGLALQGSLANFAGGILILLFRPFKVGEYIEAQGTGGSVKEINIFSTILTTPEHQMISIPNGQLANGNIINYSRLKNRRIDIKIGVSYDTDITKARNILLPLLTDHRHILDEPTPEVLVENLGGSSVDLVLRAFIPIEYYWEAYFSLREQAKIALDNAGIEIPFPQTVVHIKK